MPYLRFTFACLFLVIALGGCKNKNPYFVNDILLVSPDNNAFLFRNQLYFRWHAVDAFSNTLQISPTSGFSVLLADTLADSTALVTNVASFDLGAKYYWRVLSEPNAGEIITSAVRTFTVTDTRDSLKGTFSATVRKQSWNLPLQPLQDTTFTTTVTISKLSGSKLKTVCAETPSLNDMGPHNDNLPYHFGNDGTGINPYILGNYDTLLRRIDLEFSGGNSNSGYHYWFTIYK